MDLLVLPQAPPDLRAALFRVAADIPGVRFEGKARDSLGRRGVSVAFGETGLTAVLTDEPVSTLTFDARTGEFLERAERVEDENEPPISLTTYAQSTVVDREGLRPDGTKVR